MNTNKDNGTQPKNLILTISSMTRNHEMRHDNKAKRDSFLEIGSRFSRPDFNSYNVEIIVEDRTKLTRVPTIFFLCEALKNVLVPFKICR